MKKEWFDSERRRAKPDSVYLPARSYGKTYARKLGRAGVSPAYREDDVSHLFPLLDKIATFDNIWLAGIAGSATVVAFCAVFKKAQFLSKDLADCSVPLWLDKCLVVLPEAGLYAGYAYNEDLQRWYASQMPVFVFELSRTRMRRLLIEWAEKPLTTLP